MPTATRTCDHCGCVYTRRRTSEAGKYCSNACDGARRKLARRATCQRCKVTFEYRRTNAPKHCSRQCAADSLRRVVQCLCAQCGTPYERTLANAGKYCSRECSGVGRRSASPGARRMTWAPDSSLADKRGYVGEHRLVLFKRIGPGTHACNWCQEPVTWMPGQRAVKGALIADHVDGDPLNNSEGNLVAACQRCNIWRERTAELITADELSVANGRGRSRAEERKCVTCGKAWLFSPSKQSNKPNRGKYCSLECMWNRNGTRNPAVAS